MAGGSFSELGVDGKELRSPVPSGEEHGASC